MERIRPPDEKQPYRTRRRECQPGDRRVYDVQKLWGRHHEMLNLSALGMKHKDIAEALGVTPQTVSNTMNSTLGKVRTEELREQRNAVVCDVMAEITSLLPECIQVYRQILTSKPLAPGEDKDEDGNPLPQPQVASLALKKQVADTLVKDIAGYVAPKQVDLRSMSLHLTGDDLEQIKAQGKAAMRELGIVVEDVS